MTKRILRIRTFNNGCVMSDVRYTANPCEEEACKIETEELENGVKIETYYVEE